MRSSSPLVALKIVPWLLSVPDRTRRYVSRPDERVGGGLEHADEGLAAVRRATSTSLPALSVAAYGPSSSGEGR